MSGGKAEQGIKIGVKIPIIGKSGIAEKLK